MGALTLKQYSYGGRPWELVAEVAIDVLDSMLGTIRLYYMGEELKRVLPSYGIELNSESWITDKIRYCYDGLKLQRLSNPAVIQFGKLYKVSWQRVIWNIMILFEKSNKKCSIMLGNLLDLESVYLSDLFSKLVGKKNNKSSSYFRQDYIIFEDIKMIKNCIVLGSNLRKELPRLYYTLKRLKIKLKYFGTNALTYKVSNEFLGNNLEKLMEFLNGKKIESILLSEKNLCLIGHNILRDNKCLKSIRNIEFLNVYKFLSLKFINLNLFAVEIACAEFDTNFMRKHIGWHAELLYILSSDLILNLKKEKFIGVIYQGHHIGSILNKVDVLLPSKVFLENKGQYLSLMGEIKAISSNHGPRDIVSDSEIINLIKSNICEFNNNLFVHLIRLRKALRSEYLLFKLEDIESKFIESCYYETNFIKIKFYDFINSYYDMDLLSKASKWLLNKKVISKY